MSKYWRPWSANSKSTNNTNATEQAAITAHQAPDIISLLLQAAVNDALDNANKVLCVRGRYACEICKSLFKTRAELKQHIITHGTGTTVQCPVCSQTFANQDEYEAHVITEHAQQLEYTCNICKHQFMSDRAYRYHMKTKHTKQIIDKCPYCKKVFATAHSLKRHLELHTRPTSPTSSTKSYQCRICDKSFPTLTNLDIHMLTHTFKRKAGRVPLLPKCEPCKRVFTSWSDLTEHNKKHHAKPVARLVDKPICDTCGEQFTSWKTLGNHVTTVHNPKFRPEMASAVKSSNIAKNIAKANNSNVTSYRGVHICHRCGLSFYSTIQLRKHNEDVHKV